MKNLNALGYQSAYNDYIISNKLNDFVIGRIVKQHKERYEVQITDGIFWAEITGNLKFSAKSQSDFPVVGDWVAMIDYDNLFLIHHILPRFSILQRKEVQSYGEVQPIASNIDFAFLVQAVDRDFNINRLERYLIICNTSKVKPVILLTKIDLIDESRINHIIESIKARIKSIPVFPISNQTSDGYSALQTFIEAGKTYCMLGSSGVGKSTLLNNLSGKSIMKTDAISRSSNKGKHVTSHRELIILDNGGILIDNPGMREVGIADTSSGLETTFDEIIKLSSECKFKDCTHTNEIGCAVIKAVSKEEIDQVSYENYLKMGREKTHFESTVAERKKKDKQLGKIIKEYKKTNKNKY